MAGETERRINQLYNDIHAIYDQLSSVEKVQTSHTEQLTTLNTTVAGIWTTQQQHGDKLNSLDAAVAVMSEQLREMRAIQAGHDERFTGIDQHLERADQRLDKVDQRLDKVDQRLDKVDQRFDQVDQRFDQVDQRFETQDKKLDLIMEALGISPN
ncbi:MAG: hypothetical protein ACRDP6_02190 [Actinoallomurus sp.]